MHGANTGVALTKTRGDRLTWGCCRKIRYSSWVSDGEVLLREEILTGEDVDVFFLGDLVQRLAISIIRDVDRDDVVVGGEFLLWVVVRLPDGRAIKWGVQRQRVTVVIQRNTLLSTVE